MAFTSYCVFGSDSLLVNVLAPRLRRDDMSEDDCAATQYDAAAIHGLHLHVFVFFEFPRVDLR